MEELCQSNKVAQNALEMREKALRRLVILAADRFQWSN